MTRVAEIIDRLTRAVPGAPFPHTVDTLKAGEANQEVRAIAVTFLATVEAIQEAASLGANFIITHEPTFYNHPDETGPLLGDPVYAAKRRLLETNGIAVWRYHDTLHAAEPDGILTGMLERLGWEPRARPEAPNLIDLEPVPLLDLAKHLKAKLGIESLRSMGDPELVCRCVGLLPGACGWQRQIELLGRPEVDALVVGEIAEWETSEYLRDALRLGQRKGLIVTGHAASEQAGMERVAGSLGALFPGIPVMFIQTRSLFQVH